MNLDSIAPQPQFFGQLHNQALDYVYHNFSSLRKVNTLTPLYAAKIQQTALSSLQNFFRLKIPNGVWIANDAAQNTIAKLYELDNNYDAFEKYVFKNVFFSPRGTEYVNNLRSILDGDLEPVRFQETLTSLYNEVFESTLIKRESQQLLSIIQIVMYSSKYWADEANTEKWSNLFVNPESSLSLKKKFNWGSCGNADVGGALGGAATIGVTAVFVGPVTWGAAGTAILGGAAAGSIANAWQQYFP